MTSHKEALEAAAKALGHEGVYIHTSTFERAISAYLSTLSPDVSGLVKRLREMRENWALGSKGPIILTEAADALTSLSLQLAAVEGASVATAPLTHVRVKPLEWKKVALDSANWNWLEVAKAETPFGTYSLQKHTKGFLRVIFGTQRVGHFEPDERAEAEASAQSDFEGRIRAALDAPPPQTRAEGIWQSREGCVGVMTARRTTYFLERFKREEKMLGPHEQWALDFAIAALSTPSKGKESP